jgi:hypothetical protein
MKFGDDPANSSGVISLFVCSVVAKPRIKLDRNLVCELLLPSGTYVQCFGPIALSWFSKIAWWPYLKSVQTQTW